MTKALRAASDLPVHVCCMRQHAATHCARMCGSEEEDEEERKKSMEKRIKSYIKEGK